jgi:hypothetical protein
MVSTKQILKHGLNKAEERGKEKYQDGGVCRETQTDNRTFAKICAHRTGQEGLICG